MLVDGQGNFGSVDGDNAAAMRYTEIRLAKIAHEMLADIDKDTVDFGPNYDGSEKEPLVLPARVPNLLVNGSAGIAVGMATNIPPHNLNEVVDACLHLLKNEQATLEELMEIIPAPDFPTAGIIYGLNGVREGYRTGRGKVVMRAKCHFEEIDKGARQSIIVDEIPYQVNKKTLLERIAELVHEKKLEGISHIQDESDKSGMRVVIELKRGEVPEVVLNNLYKQTQLQDTFGINMVALIDGQPRLCNLKQLLDIFLEHRREVVTRRTVFELRKARERGHVLEGLAVALANIDEFIETIKTSPTPPVAKAALMAKSWDSSMVREMLARAEADTPGGRAAYRPEGLPDHYGLQADGLYRLSDDQASEILQMRLQRLTGLEQDKIIGEYKEVMAQIADLLDILAKPARVTAIITDELTALKQEFGQTKIGARRSVIEHNVQELGTEDLITPTDMVVTLSHTGYIKSQPLAEYRAQRRGHRVKKATPPKEDE
jgi:DNA gyrase subunit A